MLCHITCVILCYITCYKIAASTIAASSVCKHEILTDRLKKIQLRTV